MGSIKTGYFLTTSDYYQLLKNYTAECSSARVEMAKITDVLEKSPAQSIVASQISLRDCINHDVPSYVNIINSSLNP
jgi:hypothetical protein